MRAPTRVRQEHRALPRSTYGSLKDATCWPRWACCKPLKEQVHSVGIRWNLSVTRRLCIDQAPILSTRRRPESVAFVKPVRGCSGVAPSRCSGEPRWPPGGRPASPAPGRHGTGGGALLYGLDRDTYGHDPGRGRGFSRPSTARSPSLPEGHLRGVESRRKGLPGRALSRACTQLRDRAERPRFGSGHQTVGLECERLAGSPRNGWTRRCAAGRRCFAQYGEDEDELALPPVNGASPLPRCCCCLPLFFLGLPSEQEEREKERRERGRWNCLGKRITTKARYAPTMHR